MFDIIINKVNQINFMANDIINVLHFQGHSQDFYINSILYPMMYNFKLENPYDIDIISIWTDEEQCILKKQLDSHGINLINALPKTYDVTQPWDMRNKIKFYIKALEKSTKEIVMLLDGNDTIIASFDNLLEKFKKSRYKILFNASKNNYPGTDIGVIETGLCENVYFNGGCCIGYRTALLAFYRYAYKFIDVENPWKSEQYILRHAFQDIVSKPNQRIIMIDADSRIFKTMMNTTMIKVDDKKYLII